MPPTRQDVPHYARRMLDRHGDRALTIARDMVSQLQSMGDVQGADHWLQIIVAIGELRRPRGDKPG